MEQITFIPIETSEDIVSYRLSVFYDYNLYETEITNETFASEFVELEFLEDLIQEGLKPSITNKIDDNLKVITTFELNSIDDTLSINIDLKYQKGRLKARNERYEFSLKKKEIDNQTTLENVLRGLKKSFNIPQITPGSSNIFIQLDNVNKSVYFMDPADKRKKIELMVGINIKPDFLDLILSRDEPLCKFFTNRLNSQEAINGEIAKALDKYFDSELIFELVINYMSRKYCINFIQIFKKGTEIMLNVLLKKQPKESVYYVTENIEGFEFDEKLNYRILSEFEYIKKLESEENIEEYHLEIMYNANGHINILKNGSHIHDKVFSLIDINGTKYFHKSTNVHAHHFYKDIECKKPHNDRLRFSSGVGIELDGNGKINGNAVYLACCSYNAACNCRNIPSYPFTRHTLYQPKPQSSKPQAKPSKTFYLIEQF